MFLRLELNFCEIFILLIKILAKQVKVGFLLVDALVVNKEHTLGVLIIREVLGYLIIQSMLVLFREQPIDTQVCSDLLKWRHDYDVHFDTPYLQ